MSFGKPKSRAIAVHRRKLVDEEFDAPACPRSGSINNDDIGETATGVLRWPTVQHSKSIIIDLLCCTETVMENHRSLNTQRTIIASLLVDGEIVRYPCVVTTLYFICILYVCLHIEPWTLCRLQSNMDHVCLCCRSVMN
jgi:hypothetical protein